MIKKVVNNIIHTGTASIENERLKRKVILSNMLALSVSCFFVSIAVVFFFFVNKSPVLGYFLLGMIYSLVIVFNKYGHHTYSRLHLILIPSTNLMIVSGFTSEDVCIALKISQIGIIVVPLILFDLKEKTLLTSGIAWVLGIFYLTDLVNPHIPMMVNNPEIYSSPAYANFNAGVTFLFIILSYIYLQKLNIRAEEKIYQLYEETHEQKIQIQKRNDKITDSLNYATYIQKAVLSRTDVLKEHTKEFFLIYKPKDIVSGDFYVFKKIDTYLVVIVADGTGHGVPGAFMSMLGISFLTEVLRKTDLSQANQALNELGSQIKSALHQQDFSTDTRDGMDLALLVVDTSNGKAQFTGANRPLYIIKRDEEEITEYRGDRKPIGIYDKDHEYKNFSFEIEENDCIYLFSDGYKDQFGGGDSRQLKSNNFKNLLLSVKDKPMEYQKQELVTFHQKWRGAEVQTDDILIVGLRF